MIIVNRFNEVESEKTGSLYLLTSSGLAGC